MAVRNLFSSVAAFVALMCAPLAAEESDAQIVRGGSVATESRDFDFSVPGDKSQGNIKPIPATPPVLTRSDDPQPLKLAPRSSEEKGATKSPIAKPIDSLITMGGSLCVVLSIFCGLAVLMRRGVPKASGKLPGEVIEVLGKTPLVKGQDLQLVRIGSKLLLVCISAGGCETLTEITDEDEVDRLSAICRRNNPASMTAAFHQALTGLGREPASGFTGNARTSDRRGGRYG